MARTPEGAALTQQHRRAQLVLRADVLADLTRLWTLFRRDGDLVDVFTRFAAAAEILIRQRHQDSTGLAAAYFQQFREAEGVPGSAAPRPEPAPPREVARESLATAGRAGAVSGLRSGRTVDDAARTGFVRVAGTASNLVLGGGRRTVVRSVRADQQARGWQRITSGSPCHFCAMIASRGPAFESRESSRFRAHDHCACEPEPFYPGSRPPAANQRFEQLWIDSTRGLSGRDAQIAFRRAIEGRD